MATPTRKYHYPLLKLPAAWLNEGLNDRNVQRGEPDECWIWIGSLSGGYGYITLPKELGGMKAGAHRLSYAATYPDRFRDDLPVRRMCEARACVNPKHLFQRGMIGKYAGKRTFKGTRLTEAAVRAIHAWSDRGMDIKFLAKVYHITPAEIESILKRRLK